MGRTTGRGTEGRAWLALACVPARRLRPAGLGLGLAALASTIGALGCLTPIGPPGPAEVVVLSDDPELGTPEPGPIGAPAGAAGGAASRFDAEPAALPEDLDDLLWHAGREALPGLSNVRAAERQRARDEALETLAALVGSSAGGALEERLAARLAPPIERRAPWCEAARVVGRLGLYSQAPAVADALRPEGAPTACRLAAQDALHRLYGRWFDSWDDVEPYLRQVRAGVGTTLLVSDLLAEERRSNERLFVSLAERPEAALERLADRDPEVRARAAGIAGRAVAEARLDAAALFAALLPRIEHELHPRAFAALLEAALVPLASALPDAPESLALRGAIAPLAGAGQVAPDEAEGDAQPGEHRLDGDAGVARTVAAANALARLRWGNGEAAESPTNGGRRGARANGREGSAEDAAAGIGSSGSEDAGPQDAGPEDAGLQDGLAPNGTAEGVVAPHGTPAGTNGSGGAREPHSGPADSVEMAGTAEIAGPEPAPRAEVLVTIELVGAMLRSLAEGEEDAGRRPDPDATVAVLRSLNALCDQVGKGPLAPALRASGARDPVIELLRDPARDDATRAAAASVFASFVRPADVDFLVLVLHDEEVVPTISHALLGSLRALLVELPPTSPSGHRVLELVAGLAERDDPDLRRRALNVLADPSLAAHTAELEPAFLVERLDEETIPDLSVVLCDLLARFGGVAQVQPILELDGFDRLVTEEGAVANALVPALSKMAGDDPHACLSAGRRLVEIDDPGTALSRTGRALSLVARLDERAARGLTPVENRAIGSWAATLHAGGVALEEATPKGLAFVRRLLELHLPASSEGERGAAEPVRFVEPERRHLKAVLLALLVVNRDSSLSFQEVDDAFTDAIDFSLSHLREEDRLPQLARRDRARFRAAMGESDLARADFRALLADPEADEVLENADLREVIGLVRAVDEKATAPEAFDVCLRLVERPSWLKETAALRMQDLSLLVKSACDSADSVRLHRLAEGLAGLPTDDAAEGGGGDGASAEAGPAGPGPASATPPPTAVWADLERDGGRLERLRGWHAQVVELLGRG